jgi:hypothetical protein
MTHHGHRWGERWRLSNMRRETPTLPRAEIENQADHEWKQESYRHGVQHVDPHKFELTVRGRWGATTGRTTVWREAVLF